MIDTRTYPRIAILTLSSIKLISAAPTNEVPGRGVLCLGTFIYFVEKTEQQCRAGEDPEFQARIASYSKRFDDYIVRNTGGDPAVLEKFKEGQNLNSEDRRYICEGDAAESYDGFKSADAGELDRAVDALLAKNGPPSFGDCV
ncbi:hypothetical protein [Qipengyuania atrilutea]|uniref:Uncharacterized protein n=1 Tax=Qipengyuania atrilutea TaxID=2744473 RepID=A0A850H3Q5_9SPHN|nr:hypothetical protein [Actirhodobacter atriluteus]NVD44832.1 hypothetical protein [Actirhodobacter atriluteus]